MRNLVLILIMVCVCNFIQAQTIISTIGGNGIGVYGDNVHDGGPATDAEIIWPCGLYLDKSNNIYIAESGNNRIRKINASTSIISTIGGTGAHGFFGDNGPATDAQFLAPEAVWLDTLGNVFVADAGNNRIRRIDAFTGIVTTVAGSGAAGIGMGGDGGDGGPATNATLNAPVGLCLDKFGNIYIADYSNNKIKKVEAATGIITTVAGIGGPTGYTGGFVGYSGDGGPAINAQFSGVAEVFVDSSGNIFIPDQWNYAIRMVTASTGLISTIAGTGTAGYSGDYGSATNAKLNQPTGVYVDRQKNVFIAEYGDGVLRKVDGTTGIICTIAGTGTRGFSGDGGPATNAQLECSDIFLDNYGNVFIADLDNNRIREVTDPILGISPLTQPNVKVYPNPAKDELNITGVTENTNYQLLNVTGSTIIQGVLSQGSSIVPMKNCIPGIYILEMTGVDGQRSIVRIVKE